MSVASRFTRLLHTNRGVITLICLAASSAATIALAMASWNAGALSATIRIDPSTQTVAPGTEFSVNLVHNADVPIKGIGTDVRFDQTKLELVRIDLGTDWGTTGLLFGFTDKTLEENIAAANTTGLIPTVTRYRSPGVPQTISPGPKVFAIIVMRVRDGAAFGSIPMTLEKPEALDQNYASLPTSKTDGVVIIGDVPTSTATVPATETPTPSPTSTAVVGNTATPTAAPVETDTPVGPTATPTETPGPGIPGTLGVSPTTQTVDDGDQFSISVMQNLTVESSGVVADVSFDPALLQVVDVQAGTDYPSADLTVGTLGQSKAEAVAEANNTGTIKMILVYQGDSTVPAGLHEAFKLAMLANPEVSGVSPITLKNVTFYATQQISVTRIDGLVEVVGPVAPTLTPTITPSPTATLPAAATSTATASGTATPTVLAASTSTATVTATTQAPTATQTNAPTATLTPAATNTTIPAATATTAAQSTATLVPIATSTSLPGATATTAAGATSTAVAAGTNTPAAAATATRAAGSATATNTTIAVVGSPTVNPAAAQAKLNISPATITAPPGAEFTVILVQDAPFVTTGAQASFKFDPALIQVVALEKSAAYQKAALVAGVQQTAAQAIAEANTTGTLKNVAAFFTPPASLPAGPAEFLRIKVKSSGTASNTTTAISLLDIEMLDKDGLTLTVAAANGQVTIQAGAAAPTPVGASSTVGSTVAGTTASPANRLPNAGVADSYGELNWALTISLIAMLASGGALVGSLAKKPE